MNEIRIFTIGFTKTTAEHFFERIKEAGVDRILDVRLKNASQLAGFAKKDDLRYFAKNICGVSYQHFPQLAPTQEMLDAYKKKSISWAIYEQRFFDLMASRKIEYLDKKTVDRGCLLCSENRPHHCHRRLVAEYLNERWPSVNIIHL